LMQSNGGKISHTCRISRDLFQTIKITTTTDYKSPAAHSLPSSLFNQQKKIKEVKLCNNVKNFFEHQSI
jgi:hypothetical protein